ncbi:MAG TPA: pyrroloquinoline quinone biosynthesis peptide chaperone PqqD [Candidatus Acidoferrum sp.]|nr:pyrroloquinoline quinone biosynthesis peptide chaperone PqqD [Candidatus Acidoferrum sp.]
MPRLNRGVRLRSEPDGSTLLLVPEGILRLNDTAAAILALVDGERTIDAIVDALAARFEVPREDLLRDVGELIDRLTLRGYVTS